ncbi:HD domain-containing protein [Tricharina praecox]|uniref:HD domain-containing protein n=1 Tax=Tricharina praecox TaxID=43433 RepID=UPI00221EC211|nr:HD domain-containing protein [Tricharina praecox]KAI5854267.1 HD domain-containing protein [Tricharina praecox]
MSSNGAPHDSASMVKDWTLPKVLATIPKPVTSASSSPLHFLHIIRRLKTTPREGWRRFDIQNGESIADHMYRMGIITMLCPPETGIDRDRCVKLALIHDMAEALVGDITPPDNIAKDEKYKRELESMRYICDELLKPISETIAEEFMELWAEYETGTTKEAVFVKDVDRFELICQTIEYEKQYNAEKDLSEFLHVRVGIKNDFVLKWVEDALLERAAYWKSKCLEPKVE